MRDIERLLAIGVTGTNICVRLRPEAQFDGRVLRDKRPKLTEDTLVRFIWIVRVNHAKV